MDKKQKIITIILVGLIAVGLAYIVSPAVQETDATPITIGFIGPLSGEEYEKGKGAQSAVEIAVDEVNAAGGIDGRPLAVIYKDGKCEREASAAAASELIQANAVPSILGGACSHETMAFTAMAEQAQTVVLSYCSIASEISGAGDYIFRNNPSAPHLARFAAKYIKKVAGKEQMAILYVNEAYGISVADELGKYFTEGGGQVVARESYEQVDRDFSEQVATIQEANPDVIYFVGYSDGLIAGIQQIREAGIETQVFGGIEWDNARVWQEPAAEGVQYIASFARVSDSFKNALRSRFGITEILDCTPQAYDGLKILAQTMTAVGTNPEDIKNKLYQTIYQSDISSNEVAFDENGDVLTATYLVKRIEDGISTEVEYYRTDQHGDYIQANTHQPNTHQPNTAIGVPERLTR